MILHINDTMMISDLQDKFSRCFPGLKIEFYKKPSHFNEAASPKNLIAVTQLVGAIRKNHEPGNMEIMSWYTPERLEREFRDKFGLNVQVFRYENGAWIQTYATRTYTLAEQMDLSQHAVCCLFPKFRKQYKEYEYL